MTLSPIRDIKRRQVHVLDGVDHEPRQMIRRQPIPNVQREQKPLLTPAFNKVLGHTEIV
jgi:hypothetical protein